MDVNQIFEESLQSLLPMLTSLLVQMIPLIFPILAVTIGLPLVLNLFEFIIFGRKQTQFDLYKESAESFGGHMEYDEDGELDAIGYGNFDNSEYDDLEDYDESEDYTDDEFYYDDGPCVWYPVEEEEKDVVDSDDEED